MGGWFSKDSADNTVNKGQSTTTSNNITIQESVEIHNDIIILLLVIITIILVAQFALKICAMSRNEMKKRYRSQFQLNTLLQRPYTSSGNNEH